MGRWQRRASWSSVVLTGLFGVACGGLIQLAPTERHEGAEATRRLGLLVQHPLPPTEQARYARDAALDWIVEGEVLLSRDAAQTWFDTLVLPCQQETRPAKVRAAAMVEPPLIAPGPAVAKGCTGPTGPSYRVWLLDDGDPAGIRFEVFSM